MPKGTPSSPDFNHDGHVSRSEAKKAKFKVQAADTNDDGRITRSEAKKMKELKLGPVKFASLEWAASDRRPGSTRSEPDDDCDDINRVFARRVGTRPVAGHERVSSKHRISRSAFNTFEN